MNQQKNNGNPKKAANERDLKEFKILFPETREVEVGTETFVVARLNLRQYKLVFDSIGELAVQIQSDPTILENFEENLPQLIAMCFDQIVAICAASIDVSPNYIENNFDLLSLSRLALAIVELNDIAEIIKNLQSLWEKTGLEFPSVAETTETA